MIKLGLRPAAAPPGIPIELGPLLSPYEGYPHLSLRVERLPIRARLSRGRNNGDRTWSLTPDDLDGLTYLPPDPKAEPPILTIRVISVDDDHGATLAVLDFPVLRDDATTELSLGGSDPDTEAELRRLHHALAAQRADAAEARQRLEQAWTEKSRQTTEAELAAARTAWGAELAERLTEAAAHAAASLEKSRAAWDAEQEAVTQERLERAHETWQCEINATLSRAEESGKAAEAVRLAAAEARWREQSAQALAAATQAARAEHDTALAETRHALENSWAEKSRAMIAAELAASRTLWDAERAARSSEAAAQLEQSRAAWLADQEARFAQADRLAQERLDQACECWRQEAEAAVAAAEAHWREQSARALADATQAARAERDAAVAEARRVVENSWSDKSRQMIAAELDAARTVWDAGLEQSRAAWLADQEARQAEADARAQQRFEHARERWLQEAQAALTQAEEGWTSAEAVRRAAAEEIWREQSTRALADAAQTAHADRERAVAEARRAVENSWTEKSRSMIDAERAASRTALDAELAARLTEAASDAEARLEASQAAWLADQEKRGAESDACAQQRLDQARERWQYEAEAALAQAEDAWTSDAADRLVAAEAAWRAQSAHALADAASRFEQVEAALAEARAQTEAGRDPAANDELRRLRAELAATQAMLADREAGTAEMRQRLEQAWAEKSRQTVEAELIATRTAWGAELAERLSEASALAAAKLEKTRAAWPAEHEARVQERLEQARETWQHETEAALATAEDSWKVDEAARLAATEADWRAQSAQTLAEATARFEHAEAALAKAALAEAARDRRIDDEFHRLRDELAAVQQDAAATLDRSRAAWAAEEELRLAAAETQWRERFARPPVAVAGDTGAATELRNEITVLRASLAARDTELAQARSAGEPTRDQWKAETEAILRKAEESWKAAEAKRLAAAQSTWQKDANVATAKSAHAKAINRQRHAKLARHVIRGGAVAASLAATVLLYPYAEPMVVDGWWPRIHQLVAARIGDAAAAPSAAPAIELAQTATRHTVIDVTQAKLRAGPSTSTAVITTLARDKEVTPVERRGYWVLVRIGGEDGKSKQEGWIYSSFLKDSDSREASR